MNWFGELGVFASSCWLFVSIAFLPRLIKGNDKLAIIVLVGSAVIYYGFDFIAPQPVSTDVIFGLASVVATLLAVIHREIIERRRTGRWRFLDPGISDKKE